MNAVSSLAGNQKAELYYQNHKRYLKLIMEGHEDKALEVLKRSDGFYTEYYTEDPQAFHRAHSKVPEWEQCCRDGIRCRGLCSR